MTQSALITWDLPTTRSNGNAQDPALLVQVNVGFSADLGANFTVFPPVDAQGVQELLIPDLVDGEYIVRLSVSDGNGVGADVDTSFVIDTSLPGTVTNVVVALS